MWSSNYSNIYIDFHFFRIHFLLQYLGYFKLSNLWLFLRVVPRVFRPVMCRDSLKILKILRMRKICAALAMYSREYWEDKRLRNTETKNGRIPRRSIILRNEMRNSNWNCFLNIEEENWYPIITLYGETINLMRYSRVNHPTKIASVTLKK